VEVAFLHSHLLLRYLLLVVSGRFSLCHETESQRRPLHSWPVVLGDGVPSSAGVLSTAVRVGETCYVYSIGKEINSVGCWNGVLVQPEEACKTGTMDRPYRLHHLSDVYEPSCSSRLSFSGS